MPTLIPYALVFAGLSLLTWTLLSGPASDLKALLRLTGRVNRRLPLSRYRQAVSAKFKRAGSPEADFNAFFTLKEALFLLVLAAARFPIGASWPVALCCAVLAFFIPDIWLNDRIKKRRIEIKNAFVPFMDLLALALESGMDFIRSLNFLVEKFPACALTQEMESVRFDIELGASREKALAGFSDRMQDDDIRNFTALAIQSDKTGASLGRDLRTLLLSVRTAQMHAAEKMAHEAPVKLLGPLVLFIFPVVFIVLFGPIVIRYLGY